MAGRSLWHCVPDLLQDLIQVLVGIASFVGVPRNRASIDIITLTKTRNSVISLSLRYLDSGILVHALGRMVWYNFWSKCGF